MSCVLLKRSMKCVADGIFSTILTAQQVHRIMPPVVTERCHTVTTSLSSDIWNMTYHYRCQDNAVMVDLRTE